MRSSTLIHTDNYSWLIILLWLSVGTVTVFGATKACRFLLSRSEKKSEEWRDVQRESYNGLHLKNIEEY